MIAKLYRKCSDLCSDTIESIGWQGRHARTQGLAKKLAGLLQLLRLLNGVM